MTNENTTKAKPRKPGGDEMRAEYDFSIAVRGKCYKRVQVSTNVVVLDLDVAESSKNSMVVNERYAIYCTLPMQQYA